MTCQCPICFEEISDGAHSLPCGHIFCTGCVESLAGSARTRSGQVSCPSCRRLYVPRMSAEVVRRVFLNSNNPSDSSNTVHSDTSSTSRPIVANDAEVTLLREQLNTAQRQRAEAAAETNRLNDVLATTRRESMLKSNEINSLKQQLRDNAYALEQSLNSHTSYRASAQGIFESFQNENNRLKNEIMELKAELRVANSHIQASRGRNFPCVSRDPAASTAAQSTLGSSSSSIPDEPPSARVQSQQTARIPSALNGRVIRTGNISNINTSLLAPVVSPVSTVPHPAPAQAQASRPRALKRGADILCRGYRRPQQTAVPECTSADGYHNFSGKGSNQYAAKYTCTECHFRCSESRR